MSWYIPTLIEARMRTRVIVTLKTGEAFRGLAFDQDKRVLILREAVALNGSEQVSVDGELIILWPDVAYIQRP